MTLVQMTVSGGILILVIALLRLVGRRLPRRMFTALWAVAAVRLLVPITFPSPTSVYNAPILKEVGTTTAFLSPPVAGMAPQMIGTIPTDQGWAYIPPQLAPVQTAPSVWLVIWLVVAAALAGYFLFVHVRGRRLYAQALPMEHAAARNWLAAHPLRRTILLRQSDCIAAPLTYGLVRPVILLPAAMETAEETALCHVLAHEWTHIRRWDALYKLLLCAALCLHWFNPAVWLLAALAERDLELSCDEAVLARLEREGRSGYARTLLELEERRGGLAPLGSHFSKSAVEARIRAIVKYRKATKAAIVAAVALVVGVTALFATSASKKSYAQTNYAPLMALRFEGYEDLTVGEYRRQIQARIGEGIDEETYLGLFDAILEDETLRTTAMTDEDAFFLMNTLRLTAMDSWRRWYLDGSGVRGGVELDLAVEYWLRDPEGITVGERDRALWGVVDDTWKFLEGKPAEELAGEYAINRALSREFLRLEGAWETEHLDLDTRGEYAYFENQAEQQLAQQALQESLDQIASQQDYDKILALMSDGWQNLTVEEASNRIFRAGDDPDFAAAMERVAMSYAMWHTREVMGVENPMLSAKEQELIYGDWRHCVAENTAIVRNDYEKAPVLPRHEEEWFLFRSAPAEHLRWDDSPFEAQAYFYCWWDIPDKTNVTVGERERRISAVRAEMLEYLRSQSDDQLARGDETQVDFQRRFSAICLAHSDERMTLSPDRCEISVSDNRAQMEDAARREGLETQEQRAGEILRQFESTLRTIPS